MKNNKILKSLVIMLIMLLTITGCSSKNLTSTEVQPEDIKSVEVQEVPEVDDKEAIDNVEDNVVNNKNTKDDFVSQGDIEIHFIDVGQGDSVLITQNGKNLLIDAGERHMGETVTSYIKKQGIDTLDYVIGTHPHSDHIGGLPEVIDNLNVKNVIMPDKIHTTQIFEKLLSSIANKGLKITTPNVGDTYTLGDAKFTIIAPNNSSYNNLNNYSVSVKLEYGNNSFVFTGDNEQMAEKEIVNNGLNIEADLMKAGHHGSNTSNTDELLDKVNPDYVIIQVGEGNKYNHPDKDIIEKFEQRGIQVYRNDLHGTVIVKSNGEKITISTDKKNVAQDTNVNKSVAGKKENVNKIEKSEESKPIASFIGTKTTKKLHKSDCRHVPKKENQVHFSNFQNAIDEGYEPCKVCKPE